MAARKIALLIGVDDYGAGLSSLQCPANGVTALHTVLSCREIGGFDEVVVLVNPDVGEMRSRISEVFAKLTKRDLVLFYFTGHGLKDMTGDFYLTTSQTELFSNGRPNAGTAVEAHFLKRELSNCRAERKVVILDCCFGAAFADGFLTMSDDSVDIEAQLGGKGWCILTSSTSARYALEQKGEQLSVYTRYLVEGLKTGGAAPDGQDFISAQNLHEYVRSQVEVAAPAMEPAIFNGQQGYKIIIASVQLDNEQRYRKQVQNKVRNGTIGPAGLAVLEQWQQRLKLSAVRAKAIENEILQPYRERTKHLALYTQALEAEKNVAYPLNQVAIQDLKDLQRLLRLRDEDVHLVESQLLGPDYPIDCPVNKDQTTSDEARSIARPIIHPINQENRVDIPPSGLEQAKRWAHPGNVRLRASQRSAFDTVQLNTIQFDTVRIDSQGKVVQRVRREATTFVEQLSDRISLSMVRIPGGTFLLGAATGEREASDNEYPQREITLPDFWIGQSTITQAQWKALMGPKAIAKKTASRSAHAMKRPQQPIDSIFWTDAVEFCYKLSQNTGRDYRLPSDSQWEYACRAKTTTPFYFGETLTPALANYNGNYAYGAGPRGLYRQHTTEVGSFPANDFGLFDMHGNVWEWCLDGWQSVKDNPSLNHNIQRLSSQKKSLRGGSWFYLPSNCRSACRLTYPFHNRTDDIGFRVVCLSP